MFNFSSFTAPPTANVPSQPYSGGGTGSLFSRPPAPLYPTIATQPVPYPKDTKFSELPAEMQANLEAIERTIRLASEQHVILTSRNYEATEKISKDISRLQERLQAAEATEEVCQGQLKATKHLLYAFWRYGESVSRAVMASRQVGVDGKVKWVPVLGPADQTLLEELVAKLESQVRELVTGAFSLGRQLDRLSTPSGDTNSLDMLIFSLNSQIEALLALAGQAASLHEEVERLKDEYRRFLQKYRSDYRDPFGRTSLAGPAAQASSKSSFASTLATSASIPPSSGVPTAMPTPLPSIFPSVVKPTFPSSSNVMGLGMTSQPAFAPTVASDALNSKRRTSALPASSLLRTPNPFI